MDDSAEEKELKPSEEDRNRCDSGPKEGRSTLPAGFPARSIPLGRRIPTAGQIRARESRGGNEEIPCNQGLETRGYWPRDRDKKRLAIRERAEAAVSA